MQNTLKQFEKNAHKVRLTADEKSAMRGELLRYIEMHPAKSTPNTNRGFSKARQSIPSPFSIGSLRSRKTLPVFAIAALLMGGSTSFAAEGSLPGDILYPVKIHVNEAFRGAVAVSPKAKADWEVRLVERRLEEIEKLATTPSASPVIREVAQASFKHYADQVSVRIAKFEEDHDDEDALQTAGSLSSMLHEHEDTLSALALQSAAVGAIVASTSTIIATTTNSADVMVTAVSVATTTYPVMHSDTASLREVIGKLHEARGRAEGKHQELERKYRSEKPAESNTTSSASESFKLQSGESKKSNFKIKNEEDKLPASWISSSPASTTVASTTQEGVQSALPVSLQEASVFSASFERGESRKTGDSKKNERTWGNHNE